MTPAQLSLVSPSPGGQIPDTVRASQRDGYFELLRLLALIQVMVVNLVSFIWYPATFPAVGIVFAIGGSLLAGSLDRSPHRPSPVIKKQVVRLLAPVWAMAAVLVPAMIVLGWTNTEQGQPFDWVSLLKWIVPISPPPVSDLGAQLAVPFWSWALSCYLWLLLLSPALLWLFRRWPKWTLAMPLALLVLNVVGLAPFAGDSGDVVLGLGTFAACWLVGFAHHDGLLNRIRIPVVLAVGVALCAIGIACAYALPTLDGSVVPDETPLAYGFLSLGMVLILLRLHPHVHGRLAAHGVLTNLVTAISHRGLTVYLWGNASISLSLYLIQLASTQPWWPQNLDEQTWLAMTLVLSTVLLLICAICFGWVEDKAAGRPASINPWPTGANAKRETTGPADSPPAAHLVPAVVARTTRRAHRLTALAGRLRRVLWLAASACAALVVCAGLETQAPDGPNIGSGPHPRTHEESRSSLTAWRDAKSTGPGSQAGRHDPGCVLAPDPPPPLTTPEAHAALAAELSQPTRKAIARMLVSTSENSSSDWEAQYGFIEYNVEENPTDNRGYTAGIIGFTSKTGDMLELVRGYMEDAPDNPLGRYLPALAAVEGTSSEEGLGAPFKEAWEDAAEDPRFQLAQRTKADEGYFYPAVGRARLDGLGPLGQFIYYDAMVMHGPGDSAFDFGGIRAAAIRKAMTPAQGGDEAAYLAAFLEARADAMANEVAHSSSSRVDTQQRRFLQAGNLDLTLPLTWTVNSHDYHLGAGDLKQC